MTRKCRNCVYITRSIDGTAWKDIDTGQGICHHEGSSDDVDLDIIRDSENCNAFKEYRVKQMGKEYVDISDEQRKKLPDDFVLYACPICECSLFALDQNTLEDGGTSTEICCLGCGHMILA